MASTTASPEPLASSSASSPDFQSWSADCLAQIESLLERSLPPDAASAGLGAAMRYAVLDGGKRLRPLLALATAQAVTGALPPAGSPVWRAACAVELIHAYSLVHDDLPCMDNDVLRRGKPTVHVKFGEAQALLAGDALQTLAFELLLPQDGSLAPALAAGLCRQLARASGWAGMAGGQAIDLAGVGQVLDQARLEDMHRRKTGALLLASVEMGALAASADDATRVALAAYGRALGLAFQVVDDILDVTADSATLGKTAGKDAAADKPTFVSLLGLPAAQAYADELLGQAHRALDQAGLPRAERLHAIADWVVRRNH